MWKRYKFVIILLVVPFLILISWFKDGGIHGQGEESLSFYDSSTSNKLYSTTWRDSNSAGYYNPVDISRVTIFSILQMLSKLGVPNYLIQAFVDYLLMVTGTLAVYFLVKSTIKTDFNDSWIPLIAALFYLLNPFTISQIWGRGSYMQFFPFALHPLFLFLYVFAIRKRNILPILLALIASFILSATFGHVAHTASLWVLILLYSIFHGYFYRKDILLTIIFFSILFIGWILTQGWWQALYFKSTVDIYTSTTISTENMGTLLGVSKDYSLPSVIRLIHDGFFFRDPKYKEIYSSIPFQLISWLIPISALFSIKYLKKSVNLKYFGIIFLVGIFVSLGANFPTGFIFTWLFTHIPPLQIFRNPFEKFGLVFILGYSALFAVGVMHLSTKAKRRWKLIIPGALLGLILGVYSWPIWIGKVISGIDSEVGIIVPTYYQNLKNWIHSQELEGYRLVMLPIATGEGVVYKWGDRLYNGVAPSEYLLDYPTISSTPRFAYLYDYLHALRKYIPQMNVAPAISLLGAKYIVDRQDMVMISQAETEQKIHLLDKIYPAVGIENTDKVICQNLTKGQQVESSFLLACKVIGDQSNWKNIKYLHIKVRTNIPAFLEIAIRDSKSNRPRWDGKADNQYTTNSSNTEIVDISLGAPTEYNEKINMSDIILIEVNAYPKDKGKIVNSIKLDGIWLDEGQEEKVDEYSFVTSFTNLHLYQNNKFNSPPHFGVLENTVKVESFKELFEKAYSERSKVDRLGFLLFEQNSKRDLTKIIDSKVVVLDSSKISNTKYFIKVNSTTAANLILSELFDPNWKVISNVDKEELNGGFLDDLKLLKKSYLNESNHFVVNGYANLWTVQGSKQYAVVFLPQIIKDTGFTIALYVSGLLSFFSGILILRKFLK